MLQGCFSALSLRNLICSLLIKCVSALHSMWQIFEQVKMAHSQMRHQFVAVLLSGALWNVCPSPCTQTPLSVQVFCGQKYFFYKSNLSPILIKPTHSFSQVVLIVVPCSHRPYFTFGLIQEVELHGNKEKLDVGAKSQFNPPLPSVRHGYLFICSFFVGFCLCFIRQLISPVSLKQELIRFTTACLLWIPLLCVMCDWEKKHHAYRTLTPTPPCIPKIQKMETQTCIPTHVHRLLTINSKILQYHKAGRQEV